jgi:chorismate mutase
MKDCNAQIADRVILDAVLSQIMSPSFVESLCREISSQMIDTKQLDHELGIANNPLVTAERSISRLLALAEESGEIKELAQRLNQLQEERDEYAARVKRLKAERAQEIPELTPEALSLWFSIVRGQIETATQSGDILTAKRLLAQIVGKIELGRDKSIIHLAIPGGIPSDDEQNLSAHWKPCACEVFLVPLYTMDSCIVIIFQYGEICDIIP